MIINFSDIKLYERPLTLCTNVPCGMVCMAASSDGRYLATVAREQPTLLWVWDVPSLRLTAALIQRYPVKCKRF